MSQELLLLLSRDTVLVNDSGTHVALMQLTTNSHACYNTEKYGEFVTSRMNGIARPAVAPLYTGKTLLELFVAVYRHSNSCALPGCIDKPFAKCHPERLTVLTAAFISDLPRLSFSSLGLARCVQPVCNDLQFARHRFDYAARLLDHPSAACRFLTIPPVSEIYLKWFDDKWTSRVRNPAGVTVWDAVGALHRDIHRWQPDWNDVRGMVTAIDEIIEKLGTAVPNYGLWWDTKANRTRITLADFIREWMHDGYFLEMAPGGAQKFMLRYDGRCAYLTSSKIVHDGLIDYEDESELQSWEEPVQEEAEEDVGEVEESVIDSANGSGSDM